MSTIVTNGHATGMVIFTGPRSVMGHIALATTGVKDKPTVIHREITRFVYIICGLTACLACLILFTWVGWIRVDHFAFMNVPDMLDDVMGTVVAFIPEGMPVAVALTLLMVARRMKAANVLPKGLSTVEMLGCVDVLCSDKTGTLTQNRMTVKSVGFVDHHLTLEEASAVASKDQEKINEYADDHALVTLKRAGYLCNEASFDPLSLNEPIEDRKTFGNPTDGAILRFAESSRLCLDVPDHYPQVFQIPFNSKNKWMLTLHKEMGSDKRDAGEYLAIVKGAPDVLLPKCSTYLSHKTNEVLKLDAEAQHNLSDLQARLSRNAERVLMLCQRHYIPKAPLGSNDLADELASDCLINMTIIGILGIFDPPRPETASTIASCRKAGIRTFMMTGDFGLTGAAIARQVGIFTSQHEPDLFATIKRQREASEDSKEEFDYRERSLLLEGKQISQLEDADWDIVCQYQEIVFGRCSPEHKLRIIDELGKRGHATAVTGDGVNDAPALKAANVGIAVVSGSDVALEAADLILLDSFDSIVDGIRLGRLVFQNLQKVISYLLPAGSWSEIWPVLLNVFFGVPLPLSSFLMIIICVFTDLFLSLSREYLSTLRRDYCT